ncbi:centrosomal protein of 295 kDa isoform X2 [Trichomycterus rosablanca]|uniref:centrosomal protein of 295 kDa isoform X2 n=1 Tax=Trichomycterus rosablanca TaxID=2290929 RepID=UPI002F34FCDE
MNRYEARGYAKLATANCQAEQKQLVCGGYFGIIFFSQCFSFVKYRWHQYHPDMKRKSTKVSRLSPNEEAQLVQEELQRRRKLRLQQVREQERYIAFQVRREVQERKEKVLQNLAATLQDEWQKEKEQKIQTLEKLYKENVQDVGQGHRNAKENEPDWDALALKREGNEERAAERHEKALRELITQRQSEAEQRNRPLEARKKALRVEKERSSRITSLPQPAPNPIENIGMETSLPPKTTKMEHYSVTHHHITETTVDRETDLKQSGAEQAAALEAQRLEELEREGARDRQEQLEKARLRGDHALRKEKVTQDRARLLCELGRLQQADLQRRRHLVSTVPAQIFQPLYRQDDLRAEQQRELEIAFQDLCTEERELRGDLILQLESEPLPLPVPSATSHSESGRDQDLDVSFDPGVTPSDGAEAPEEPVDARPIGSSAPVRSTGRPALRRLLDRIRAQRDQWGRREPLQSQGRVVTENTSNEMGPVIDHEWQQASSLEEGTADTLTSETSSKVSEGSIVAGTMKQHEEHLTEVDRQVTEEDLNRQQQEQLALLEELKEKQRQLEVQLEEAQLHRQRLQETVQVQSGMSTVHEAPRSSQELIPEPPPEVKVAAPVSDATHTQRLQQYQQRLLQQNRIHKKSLEEGFRRLDEYKQTLKLRYSIPTTAPQSPPSSTEDQTSFPFPSVDQTVTMHPLYPATRHPESCETAAAEAKDLFAESTIRPDPTLVTMPSRNSPTPIVTMQDTTSHPSSPVPDIVTHELEDDSLELIPVQEAAPLSHDLREVPLPAPSLFLELLLSNRSSASHTRPALSSELSSLMSSEPENVQPEDVGWTGSREAERNRQVREQMRKQRDLLQALLRAERTAANMDESSSLETQGDQFSLTDAHQKSNGPHVATTSIHQPSDHPPSTVPSGPCDLTNGVRMKNPVSCPPRTFHYILQDLEQHKLSTIQEVDTPANLTLDAGNEPCSERSLAEDSDYSYSVSLTPPVVGSGSSRGLGSGSEITASPDSTCKTGGLSWRDMLQLETSASHAEEHGHLNSSLISEYQVDKLKTALPQDGVSPQSDCHTSTTLSTGSYLSSDQHDPNCTITDSSVISGQSGRKAGASPICSSASCACGLPGPSESTLHNSSLQYIIEKYTKEMDISLRSVLSGGSVSPGVIGNTALSSGLERHDDTGTFAPLQLHSSLTQCPLVDRNSSNTTMQDVFQSLSPEMTHDDTAECSMAFQTPVTEGLGSPPVEENTTNSDTTSSDWQSFGLPPYSFSTNEQSASGSAVFPKWEWILAQDNTRLA